MWRVPTSSVAAVTAGVGSPRRGHSSTHTPAARSGLPEGAVSVLRRRDVDCVRGFGGGLTGGSVQQTKENACLCAEVLAGSAFFQGGGARDASVAVVAGEAVDVDPTADGLRARPAGLGRGLGEASGAVPEVAQGHGMPGCVRAVGVGHCGPRRGHGVRCVSRGSVCGSRRGTPVGRVKPVGPVAHPRAAPGPE